ALSSLAKPRLDPDELAVCQRNAVGCRSSQDDQGVRRSDQRGRRQGYRRLSQEELRQLTRCRLSGLKFRHTDGWWSSRPFTTGKRVRPLSEKLSCGFPPWAPGLCWPRSVSCLRFRKRSGKAKKPPPSTTTNPTRRPPLSPSPP